MSKTEGALRVVAVFEAAKGMLVLLAGFGLHALLQHDAQRFVEELVGRLHLNPAKGYPQVFLGLLENLSDTQLWALAALAVAYATLRFFEAYGLWRGRRWAEWIAALSGGIYVPVELYELARHVTWIKIGALILNALWVSREKARTG